MSRTLVLIRHAKAEANNPGGDHERALAERGLGDARALGSWLGESGYAADHAWISTAVRARQTYVALLSGIGEGAAEPGYYDLDRRIYSGGVDGVLAAVQEAPSQASMVWVVGHEPTLSTSIWDLSESMDEGLEDQLRTGFPTSTAAVLTTDLPWEEVGMESARLVGLHTGRG